MKSINITISVLIVICSVFSIVSCSDDDDDKTKAVESIKILGAVKDTLFMEKGGTYQLTVETTPRNQGVKYFSTNPKIFTISEDGVITTFGGGYGFLHVVAPNHLDWTRTMCVVTVKEYVDSIALNNKDMILLAPNKTENIASRFKAYPTNATNRKVTYRSSNPSVATVDADGTINVVSKGKVEIVAVPADGKHDIASEPIVVYAGYKTTVWDKTGWTITAINSHARYPVSNAIDGSNTTDWATIWSPATRPPYWLLIDMHEEVEFNNVIIHQSSYKWLKTVRIQTTPLLTDGVTENDPSFTEIGTLEFTNAITTKPLLLFPDKKHKTRYLKILMPNSTFASSVSLGEVTLEMIK